jgi:hypothetical protein
MGTKTSLYGPGGFICKATGPSYNTYVTSVWSLGQYYNCGSGNYQSVSTTFMYDSSTGGYTSGSTTATPIVTH